MTCIVGLETKNGILMGGDSAATSVWNISHTRIQKVFQNGPFLIGYTDSFRMGQLLQYHLRVEDQLDGQEDMDYLVTKFVPAVRECLKEGGYTWIENNRETSGLFMVGYRKRLYNVQSDFQVNSYRSGFMAIGCGADYALGYLWRNEKFDDPKYRIREALEAAAYFSNGVCAPFYILGENSG